MKHVFLLLTAFALSIFSSNAQSIEVINREVSNDRALVNTLRDNLSSRGGGQAVCGPDTLIYALAKATGLNIVNVNNATSVFAVSQYFDAPQDITINGASFYGFKTNTTGGISADVSVSVYLAGPDSLPTGVPLTTGIVPVDTAFGGGSLTVLIKHANFTPVTVSQPYCVVVENDSPNPIGMVVSDYTVGDGQGEWLASANLFGDWLHGYDLVLGPDQFDADALIEPHVEYTLEAGFDQTGVCIGATGGDGTWQNTSSPILGNRMYSVAAFLGSPELQYSWDYGDGSAITNTVNGANTYSGNSPWTVTLTDTLFGWTIVCVDDFIQDAETVEAGTLTALTNPACFNAGSADISAIQDAAPVVPAGYEVLYVLTDADNNLEIIDAQATPNFTVTSVGNYIIHTLVYDPNTLTPSTLLGVPALDANALLVQGGGSICAALDLAGAPITVEGPEAGTLTQVTDPVCFNAGSATFSTTQDAAPVVPTGYEVLYVLTDADNNLEIIDAQATPSFTVTSGGNYIVHTLVYDPNTLTPGDLLGVEALVANSLLVQGGGSICAALDLAGAPVTVEAPEAGTLTGGSNVCVGGSMDAVEGDAPVVPSGYEVLYVLTDSDDNLTVIGASATPSFAADSAGNYIIHTLVYDPNTLTPGALIGVEALTANSLLVQGGGTICAALDLTGAAFSVEGPEAGTLTQVTDPVCFNAGSATFSTTQDAAPIVPANYDVVYVLTDADNNLEIIDAQATPSFTVTSGGNYIIHTLVYDPNTLTPVDLLGVEALVANSLLVQGGGSVCAALDLAGAPVTVEAPEAGTLTASSPVCLFNVSTTISAAEVDAPSVPAGYEVLYVLTDANNNLEIIDAQASPDFTVSAVGDYIIHTLVYDPNTLNPGDLLGVEALTANSLLVQGGGSICAALDLTGAPITVENCPCDATAGTLTAGQSPVCVGGSIDASESTAPFVPTGYEVLYVLTDADNNLTVLNASATPSFDADSVGDFIIHTLVYDPNTLDPATAIGLEAGVVNGLLVQGGGTICAALDLTGAAVSVTGPSAGTLTGGGNVCVGSAMDATHVVSPSAPLGYEILYVLTDADNNLTVIDASATPSFSADSSGNFIIHTLVYDPNTLTPGDLIGVEALTANSLLVQGGGSICAALDLAGAPFVVEGPEAGTLTGGGEACIGGTMDAIEGDAPVIPTGYETLYILTDADDNLTVIGASATPSFAADSAGNFIIHTLVYDPNTLTPGDLIGVEALVANSLLVQGGGSICAALDLAGAPFSVEGPEAGTLTGGGNTCVGGTMDGIQGDAPVVPAGYEVLYVLTDADNNLTVIDAAATPNFDADSLGTFIIHTLVYDPNTVTPGDLIGVEALTANSLLVQGGGSICAALDLTGATFNVVGPEAGTLTAGQSPVCIGETIEATVSTAPNVPSDYEVLYVLTDADNNLTVVDAAATPSFIATAEGNFIIHTLVYDPATLTPTDLIGVEALVANSLLVQGGGSICAALDLAGAPVEVEACACDATAGTLVATESVVCTGGTMSATVGQAPIVPSGFEVLYVLTDADNNLTVIDAAATPLFDATTPGNYIIHTLVYDPATLDPTTAIGLPAATVNGLLVQGGGSICAALDLAGAPIQVAGPMAGTLTADADVVCIDNGIADISASTEDAPEVPTGFAVFYVLTDADDNLTILNVSPNSEFTVNNGGNYIIHTLVYNPEELNPADIVGAEALIVNGLLVQGGGFVCAALDLVGAPILVEAPEAGSLVADDAIVCLENGSADISATQGNAPDVPSGYEVIYVLTDADDNLTIVDASGTPEFTLTEEGNYIIHTLVYDPTVLNPADLLGEEALTANGLLVQGGGSVCAALDLNGAAITVSNCTSIQETLNAAFNVYPNPNDGQFVIEVSGFDLDAQVNVMDATGRLVYSEAAVMQSNFRQELNLDVAPGTYLLQIVTTDAVVVRKLQVQ